MPYLVRKFSKAKWLSLNLTAGHHDISADIITQDLKTASNTLSTWEIPSLDYIQEAVLALASSADNIDTIDVVWIDKTRISDLGLQIEDKPGEKVRVEDLMDTHKDVAALTYQSLGDFASEILAAINQNDYDRYTAGSIKKILRRAVNEKRLAIESLPPKMQEELERFK